jgi:ABC-type transporter Mla MlaB component
MSALTEVTHSNASAAAALWARAEGVIDLSALQRFDSSTLAALINAQRQAAKPLQIVNAPAGLKSLAAMYGVTEVLLLG